MAYDTQKLSRLAGTFDGGWGVWLYRSADSFATVKASGYISDAFAKGMKVGDVIHILDTGGPTLTIAMIVTCTASAETMSQTGVVPST